MKITAHKINITAYTAKENILFSNFRCMKIRNTNDDLKAAIRSARTTVNGPRYIRVIATDVIVRTISNART
jgi:hypothetical protein